MTQNSSESTKENRDVDLSAHQNLSQVSESKAWQHKIIHFVIVAIIVVVISLLFLSGHSKTVAPALPEAPTQNTEMSKAELATNMAKLKQTADEAKAELRNYQNQLPLLVQPNSKETLARQNAPTAMYSDSSSLNTPVATSNQANSKLFAGQSGYDDYANQTTVATSVNAVTIAHPDYTIVSGEFLHAVLETAINSDLPGMVRAVVTDNVYAYAGRRLLIPQGSRLIGQYTSAVMQGQNRVFVMWNRVVLPNSISVQLNSPGTDAMGEAGAAADDVNTHFFQRFGEASLLSIIGADVANAGVSTNDKFNSGAQYRTAISQSFQQSSQNSLQNSVPMQPTLTVHQGAQINVFVAHDLSFYNVLARGNLPNPNRYGLLDSEYGSK